MIPTKSAINMKPPKLLIVDDDAGMRSQLKWGLQEFDVITAESREDALEKIDIHQPPLVTLDLGLPPNAEGTTEGFATLKAILEVAPETKVVIVSGSDAKANAPIALDSGAFEFHAKPVDIENLQQVIHNAYEAFLLST